jgi:hypothetical protein
VCHLKTTADCAEVPGGECRCGPGAAKPPGHLGGGKCPDATMAGCADKPCLYDVLDDKTEQCALPKFFYLIL